MIFTMYLMVKGYGVMEVGIKSKNWNNNQLFCKQQRLFNTRKIVR